MPAEWCLQPALAVLVVQAQALEQLWAWNLRCPAANRLSKGTENKYEQPYSGPHPILRINNNGTVRIQKGAVTETVNIRRITPYIDNDSFEQRGGSNMRQNNKKRKLK